MTGALRKVAGRSVVLRQKKTLGIQLDWKKERLDADREEDAVEAREAGKMASEV